MLSRFPGPLTVDGSQFAGVVAVEQLEVEEEVVVLDLDLALAGGPAASSGPWFSSLWFTSDAPDSLP